MIAPDAAAVPAAPLVVERLGEGRDLDLEARWDAFVRHHPDGTFFHLSGWRRVLQDALGHGTEYLYSRRHGVITGVLPLGHINSWLFGNNLISIPFGVYGGVLATDGESQQVLLAQATALAERRQVDSLELRHRRRVCPEWPAKDQLYATFTKALDPDPEVNLKAIPRKQRAMVRKGIAAGLMADETDDVDLLFRIYAESVRNLGTPVFPRRYFHALKATFGDACRILVVRHQGSPVAAVMSFYFEDQVLPYYGGSIPTARELKANDFMYWELMRRAVEEGLGRFDYGRSKVGTGAYSFKKNWGFEPEPLVYEYHLVKAKAVPEINPLNPKYRVFIAAWKRLPLAISRRLGPLLARDLG
ncbi:MAG: FemAB family XrtA/PEP-CTERM system-associated protein [Candidatus Competibacterales bacterium]